MGFALFGWAYLGLSLVPSIESRLITTKALAYLDSKVPGRSQSTSNPAHRDWLWSTRQSGPGDRIHADGNQLATSSHGTGETLGCDDRQASRWLGWNDRELREDRTLAARPAGGLVWWAALSPSLASFQTDQSSESVELS